MTNFISGCQGAVGISMMKVTKARIAMESLLPAGEDSMQLNSRVLTSIPVISTGMMARRATMQMQMMRKMHHKPTIDQRRMWRTESIVHFTWEPVMSTGISARMVTMRTPTRRNKHYKPMMDQLRMWRAEGIVLESVKMELYISDLQNKITVEKIQHQAMYPKRRLYWNKWQNVKD